MTGKTHRVGGMVCVLGGFTYLESKGLLLRDVNPLLQLTVMYPFAIYGSVFCDLDHDIHSIPSKDIVSVAVNKVLHFPSMIPGYQNVPMLNTLNAKHRSWQTHSDLFLILLCYLLFDRLLGSVRYNAESVIVSLIGIGFLLGVISHLVLDMLTPEGIWCIVLIGLKRVLGSKKFIKDKISLVPDIKFFRTGGPWEGLVRKLLWVICGVLFIRIVYSILPYRLVIRF